MICVLKQEEDRIMCHLCPSRDGFWDGRHIPDSLQVLLTPSREVCILGSGPWRSVGH